MGEPLDNLDALLESLRGISHQCLFNIGRKKVTISTVGGSAEGIRRLAEVVPLCRLALSLHSADQTLREELIPAARKVPLPELGEALDYHAQQAGCGAMLEYLLIQGKVRGAWCVVRGAWCVVCGALCVVCGVWR